MSQVILYVIFFVPVLEFELTRCQLALDALELTPTVPPVLLRQRHDTINFVRKMTCLFKDMSQYHTKRAQICDICAMVQYQ